VKQQKQQEQGKKQQLKQEGVSSKSNVYVDCGDLVICKVFFIPFFFHWLMMNQLEKGCS
jgi:hypothetical protein